MERDARGPTAFSQATAPVAGPNTAAVAVRFDIAELGHTGMPAAGESRQSLGFPLVVLANPAVVGAGRRGPTGLERPKLASPTSGGPGFAADNDWHPCAESCNDAISTWAPCGGYATRLAPRRTMDILGPYDPAGRAPTVDVSLALNLSSCDNGIGPIIEGSWAQSAPIVGPPRIVSVTSPPPPSPPPPQGC